MKLTDLEYRFAEIIWANQPMPSGKLVKASEQKLGWKKSTTYTVLKRMSEKRLVKNENTFVSMLVQKEEVDKDASVTVVQKAFNGSLPRFITAYMDGKKLSKEEAEELKQLIDQYQEDTQ